MSSSVTENSKNIDNAEKSSLNRITTEILNLLLTSAKCTRYAYSL